MPTRPPRVCAGCGAAVTGRCPTCSPEPWARKPSSWAGGSTRRWRRFRAAWLADHPLCVGYPADYRCGRVADAVDHIRNLGGFPPEQREAARFDRGNVQSLCRACHQRKTNDESAATRIYRAQDATGQLW